LTKVWGLNIVVSTYGRAGKFSIIPLLVTFGAGVALIGISSLVCDFFLL